MAALESAGVRYLVAGGLAVNAYGYLRFTKDVDLVVQLVPETIEAAFRALATLGYRPMAPITATQFANPTLRAGWIRDKGMQVLQFWSDQHRETPVRFVSIPTLIRMKEAAGRPQDRIDIEHLRMRLGDNGGE